MCLLNIKPNNFAQSGLCGEKSKGASHDSSARQRRYRSFIHDNLMHTLSYGRFAAEARTDSRSSAEQRL